MGPGAHLPCDVIHKVCPVRTELVEYTVFVLPGGGSQGLGVEPASSRSPTPFLSVPPLTFLPPDVFHQVHTCLSALFSPSWDP